MPKAIPTTEVLESQNTDSTVKNAATENGLTAVETKMIDFFVQITKLLAIPKSVGEIYGVLFCSPTPLAVADITAKLGISKATASYALKFLSNINAIEVSKEFGVRHDLFTAVTSLRKLAFGFLSERVDPFIENRDADLAEMQDLSESLSPTSDEELAQQEFLKERVKMLVGWQRNARSVLPLVRTFFKMTS